MRPAKNMTSLDSELCQSMYYELPAEHIVYARALALSLTRKKEEDEEPRRSGWSPSGHDSPCGTSLVSLKFELNIVFQEASFFT